MKKFSPVISQAPAVTIWGAAQHVTGSMHLVQTETQKILLDCGLVLEKGAQLRNRDFPFDPEEIDCVLLTHAHLDHCGNLPTLVRQGYRGPIYCTAATRDLLHPMLYDACHVQDLETNYYNKHHRENQDPFLESIYDLQDVDDTLDLLQTIRYGKEEQLAGDVSVQFRDAGHVLGSASIHMKMSAGSSQRSITFTGDLGRSSIPLLCPVSPLLRSDFIISEATYGGQFHEPYESMQDTLVQSISETMDRGGKVLIPAFSLGRVQLVVHTLIQLIESGRLDRMPIYVDSPLSNKVLAVMENHTNLLHPTIKQDIKEGKPFLHTNYVHYIETPAESRDAMYDATPGVVVASSGMGEGGRIIHHLKQSIDDPRCTIILVSFQTPGSLGARLLEPSPTIRMGGREWNKWADVIALRGFSGHADHEELVSLLHPHIDEGAQVTLVHGEMPALSALETSLNEIRPDCASLAERGVRISL